MADEPKHDEKGPSNEEAHAEKEPGKKESGKKPIGTLESVINETSSLLKTVGGASLAVGMPLALGYAAPQMQRDAFVVGTAFSAGKIYENYKAERKTSISDIVKESAVGTLLTPPIHLGYQLMNAIDNPVLKAAAYLGPYTLGVIPLYLAIDHIVKKGFKGVYSEGIKPHVKRVVKDNYKYLALAGLLNLFFTPVYLQVPVALGLGSLFKVLAGKNKEKAQGAEKRDKTPYLAAAASFGYKAARNTAKGFYDAIYGIGKSLAEKIYSSVKPAAPAQPAAPAN
ncbi:hypothetical protein HYX08_05055 [Candidatus Woesearchaeota archaeon]|nr:hypothetical protein [Candidatus Woesearchaeota archaeon]